jgi:drug/metabolite transporter (DMT)-like permease
MRKTKKAIVFALLAAVLYALNVPLSKLLLSEIRSTVMAGLLYLGAGAGLFIVAFIQKIVGHKTKEQPLSKKDLPYTLAMIFLDIAAPVCLLYGLSRTTAANVSLLNNFEIVATSLIALFVFKEAISKRLWVAIFLVTVSSILLSFEDLRSFSFSVGSVFVLLACVCWGIENNCTRKLSAKNPLQIVVVKGFCSGAGSLMIGLCIGQTLPGGKEILAALAVGFVAYGLSIFFYVYAQRSLGAAKTSAYYAVAPFAGTFLSLLLFRERPGVSFWAALLVMAVAAALVTRETLKQR